MQEMAIAPAGPMSVVTAINFQPTGWGKADDFVLTGMNPFERQQGNHHT